MQEQERSSGPETAREAAKDFLRSYVRDGWTLQDLAKKRPYTNRDDYAAHIEIDGHIAVTRLEAVLCQGTFELADLIAEIRDEERGYQQQSLAFLFSQEEERTTQEPAPAKKRPPALFRSYIGGHCENPDCGLELGLIETDGGRNRHYCNDACRQAAHRARKREKQRQVILQQNGELREYWQRHDIHGEVLLRLQEILIKHGQEAARAATDVVRVALAAAAQAGSDEQSTLIEEIMLQAEERGFEAVIFDDCQIAAGAEAWAEFVSHASTAYMRQVRGYFYELKQRQRQAEAGRKRLESLSRDQ